MAIIVKISPVVTGLEEVARHRAKLRHGVARHEETQFIANPNPPNTTFEPPSFIPRNQRAEKGLQHGHMASIPPQHYVSSKNAMSHIVQHTPTYASANFDPEPKDPPSIGIPLDLDDPEILEGSSEIEILISQIFGKG